MKCYSCYLGIFLNKPSGFNGKYPGFSSWLTGECPTLQLAVGVFSFHRKGGVTGKPLGFVRKP